MTLPPALHTALSLAMASVTTGPVPDSVPAGKRPRSGEWAAQGVLLTPAIEAIGKGRAPCGRLHVRLQADDHPDALDVRIGGGKLVIVRRTGEGPPVVQSGPLTNDACKRIARQLASRWPREVRWPRIAKKLSRHHTGPGDTEIRIAVGPAVFRGHAAETDAWDIGFVALLRGELLRLAPVAATGSTGESP